MNVTFKITRALLDVIREDLRRSHAHAFERLGFIGVGAAQSDSGILALAQSYRPVADEDYVPDQNVGAMMGPEAIRKAMQWALDRRIGIFHVHTHEGTGLPWFSRTDLTEQDKFVPSFQNVAAHSPHGAIVLSNTGARGRVWLRRGERPTYIDEFIEVGSPIRRWSGR